MLISSKELKETFENATPSVTAIRYLEGIINKIKKGEVYSISSVALLTNGKVSLWTPGSIDGDDVSNIFGPIIEILKDAGPICEPN